MSAAYWYACTRGVDRPYPYEARVRHNHTCTHYTSFGGETNLNNEVYSLCYSVYVFMACYESVRVNDDVKCNTTISELLSTFIWSYCL